MTRGTIARNVARGAFWISVEKVVSIASTILYTALIARWLGPTKYGLFKTAFAIIGVATVLTGNFETFLERYAAEYQVQGRFTRLARAHRIALAFKLVLGALTSAIVLLVTPTLARHYEMPSLLVLLPALSLFIATDGLATTGRAMLFGLQRFKWVSGVSLIFNLGRTLLVGALWHLRQGLPELAVGLAAINTVLSHPIFE